MLGARRRNQFGPPSVLLGTAALLTALMPAAFSATVTSGATRCPSSALDAVRVQRGSSDRRVTTSLEERLSSRGELTGRVLRVDRPGMAGLLVALPAESFVGDATSGGVVYTRVVGGRSEVRLIDAVSGCDALIATPTEVVRSAILEPSGEAVYVHSVTRVGRRDAGVERHDLETGAIMLVVPPLRPPNSIGRIFGTELRWSVDSRSLAVQSCGFSRCMSRILDPESGTLTVFDAGHQGALIGTTPGHLVTYADCPGLPCPVISIDRLTGQSTVVEQEAYEAALATAGGDYILTIATLSGQREVQQ